MILLDLAVNAPLVLVEVPVAVLHALTSEGLFSGWPAGPFTAACGRERLNLLTPARWPPRVSVLPDGWTRCRDCHNATGSKRPRSELVSREEM